MTLISSSILVFAALSCDVGNFRLFTIPSGATTNGTLEARDVPGALDYANSSKRFTGGVCAATYGLREAQVMRKIFPLAIGSLAQWGGLQNSMPDLTTFDLCPTNVPSDAESQDPVYRFLVTASGERTISYKTASEASVWNGLGGTPSSTNHNVRTGAWDLVTPPESNRVFRTPRITNYLKKVIDLPINALMRSEWRKMGNYSPDNLGGWLDPTVDHASLATGTWCTDSTVGLVSDYATFLRGLSEYRKDIDATNMTAGCGMFGGSTMWKWAIPYYEEDFTSYGFPRATERFEAAKTEREQGKITDMIAKAAPGLKASITSDWQTAVQKMAASETTRLWWQRQALANGIVALQSRLFMPLGSAFFGLRPKDEIHDTILTGGRLSHIHGRERYISGTTGKTELYELPSGSVTPYFGWFDDKKQAGLMARIDASKLNTTNTVVNDNTTIEEWDVYGDDTHEAYWENTGCQVSIMLTPSREICGEEDRKTCLPNAGEDGGGGSGPVAVEFDELAPGATKEYDMSMFELVCEPTTVINPDGNEARKWVFRVYTAQTLPSGVANKFVQEFNIPIDSKWRGGGAASYSANVEGRNYSSSDAPGSWLPLPQETIQYDKTSEPLGLVTEGSKLAEMMTADMLVLESVKAGTNAHSEAWNFIDYDTNDVKNAWIYTRLSAPYRNVVPTTGALKDLMHWSMGAANVRDRMAQVIDMLPSSSADKDPFTIEKAKATGIDSLKPTVEELFPADREISGPRDTRIPWKDASAWAYVLKRSSGGVYSAEWKVKAEKAVLVEITCGGSEQTSRPTRHSVWVEYGTAQSMILKFDFPMMNSNDELKGGSP